MNVKLGVVGIDHRQLRVCVRDQYVGSYGNLRRPGDLKEQIQGTHCSQVEDCDYTVHESPKTVFMSINFPLNYII